MTRLLLVEDDEALAELIASYLGRHAFEITVVGRGDEAVTVARHLRPDLVILDLMLPGLSGLQVCQQLRAVTPDLPIIMLTARGADDDQVAGLEAGADDYVAKPCKPRVLLARVRTLLRRAAPQSPPERTTLRVGQLRLQTAERVVWWKDECVELSSGEYNLLEVLAQHAGTVLTRDMLLQSVRGIEFNGVDRSIDVTIHKLRKRFEQNPGDAKKIKTVWGKGYLMSRTEWDE